MYKSYKFIAATVAILLFYAILLFGAVLKPLHAAESVTVKDLTMNSATDTTQKSTTDLATVSSNLEKGVGGKFPTLSSENLNRKAFNFPQDFPGKRTLLLIAFERQHQEFIDSWVKGMELLNSPIEWMELPVLSRGYLFMSFMIDNGMRRGIPNSKVRDRVVTLYIDREKFAESMGFEMSPMDTVVAVVEPSGKVIGMVRGAYDSEKAKKIQHWLDDTQKN